MKVIKEIKKRDIFYYKHNAGTFYYTLDTAEWVCLHINLSCQDFCWEYQITETDDDSYVSGNFVVEGKKVIDYDGVFELPEAVVFCLSLHFLVDDIK